MLTQNESPAQLASQQPRHRTREEARREARRLSLAPRSPWEQYVERVRRLVHASSARSS